MTADSSNENSISAIVTFNDKFAKPVEVVCPAVATLQSEGKDSAGHSYSFIHRFYENGKLKSCQIII